jgi:hypothetical protein
MKKGRDYNIYKNGILFNDFERKQAFSDALSEVLAIGVDIIGDRTPVDTGRLRNSWDSTDDSIFNDTPYFPFVEYGTSKMSARLMMTKSIPEIVELFGERLANKLK